MARSINKATIMGNAGKDTELRYTANGKAYASFSVATTESWKDASGAQQERTTWHNIKAWDRLAEICGQYVKKGTQVYIEGRIENRSYDDKDGNKKYISEITANELILLGGGNRGERGNSDSGDGGGYNSGGNSNSNGGYNGSQSAPSQGGSTSQAMPTQDFDQSIPDADLPF